MFNKIRNRFTSSLFIATLMLFGTTACSMTGLVKEESNVTIERVDSQKANISHAYLTRSGDKLILRGNIKRRFTGRGPIPGHLHITLINSQDEVIKEADIGYMRRSTKSSIADFNTILPEDLAPGSKIKITHFATDTHQNHSKNTVWRDGK